MSGPITLGTQRPSWLSTKVVLEPQTTRPKEPTMTKASMALAELAEKGDGVDVLREERTIHMSTSR